MAMTRRLIQAASGIGLVVLFAIPYLGTPDFYLSYLYIIFFWIALATSWGILSGYTGYWSFGHAAFFGAGVYTAATLAGKLEAPFLVTIPAAAALAVLLSVVIGVIVFRIKSLRAEFFALLTLSVAFVISALISNTWIDGGAGVFLGNISLPPLGTSIPGVIYLFGLIIAISSLVISRAVLHSRLGIGLLAIHDDEDVAEVKGVPTFRYKLIAFAISSAIAGAAGAVHAAYVGYVTVGETFSITVPLYVVLMSILGGARHWAGPAIGATLITVALSLFVGAGQAELGRTVLVERHESAPCALLVVQRERGLVAVDVYAHHLLAEMVVEREFGIALFHSKLGAQCAVRVEEGKRPAATFGCRAEQKRRFAAVVGEGEDRGSIGQDAELRAGRAVCVVEVEIRGLMLRYAELRAPLAGLIDEDEILRGNGGRRSRRASSGE